MSIPSLTNTPSRAEICRSPARRVGTASFQDQLVQTSTVFQEAPVHARMSQQNATCSKGVCGLPGQEVYAEHTADATGASQNAASLARSAFMKEDLLSALNGAKLSMLDRMKKSKEKTDEQEDWGRLMKYVDAWIETLREEASVEKVARAYSGLKAAEADAAAGKKDLGDYILDQLTERLT